MPAYLLHIGSWKAIWPIPVMAFIIAVIVYVLGIWRWPIPDRRSIFRVIIAFSLLGIVIGMIAGDSREPAVGATLPAVLSLIGGIGIYLVGTNLGQRILVSLSVSALALALIIGFFWGAVLRVNAEHAYYGAETDSGHDNGNIIGNLAVVPVYVTDVERSLDFYKQALDFEVTVDEINLHGERVVEMSIKGQDIKFLLQKMPHKLVHPHFTDYTFSTNDIMRVYKQLRERHVKFYQEPEPATGKSFLLFSDPDGNVFCITQMPTH